MAKFAVSLSLLLLLVGSACGPNYIFDESAEIDSQLWSYADSVQFKVSIPDTSKVYNLYLDLDHNTNYPYQNLYLMAHTSFPSGKRLDQQFSINLMTRTGFWQGDCSGERCDLRVNLQEGAYFNETGVYTFSIEQYLRRDSVPGIHSLALRIEDTGVGR